MIGIFGGTFDPIHNGHLRIALDALELLDLEQVRLIPLANAVHRSQPETPGWLRVEMMEAALGSRADLVVDGRELERQGPSYTVDTLRSLKGEFAETPLCLLLGEDAFNGFADWREPDQIMQLANVAVLARPGHVTSDEPRLQSLLRQHQVPSLDPARAHGQIAFIPVTQLDIASSDIRHRIAVGCSADYLLPGSVLDVIARCGLYREQEENE